MRKSLILVLLFVSAAVAYAQKDMRQVQDYEELTDTKPHDGQIGRASCRERVL